VHGAQTGGSPLGPQQDNQQHGNAPERVGAGCPMGGLSRLTSPTSVGGIQQKPARVRKGREGGRVRNQGQPSACPMPAPEISGRMTRLPSAVGGGRLPDCPPGHPTRTPRATTRRKRLSDPTVPQCSVAAVPQRLGAAGRKLTPRPCSTAGTPHVTTLTVRKLCQVARPAPGHSNPRLRRAPLTRFLPPAARPAHQILQVGVVGDGF